MTAKKYRPVQVFDISNWNRVPAGQYGKREKDVYQNPRTNQQYYFKLSDKRYPWDFWCEIIASKFGQMLGLDTADYNPAYIRKQREDGGNLWGCLSPLLNRNSEQFVHGQEFILREQPDFDIEKGKQHSYQLIHKVLKSNRVPKGISKFHEMIVFDALICNRDRHQENWAIIQDEDLKILMPEEIPPKGYKVETFMLKLDGQPREIRYYTILKNRLSPIYDSGTSLGHNLTEIGIERKLLSPDSLSSFAFGPKAQSHIRWKNNKLRHDDLLMKILEYDPTIMSVVEKVISNFSPIRLVNMLEKIDVDYDHSDPLYVFSDSRKKFVFELLNLRINRLRDFRNLT